MGEETPTPLFKAALTYIFGRFTNHKDDEGPYLNGADFATYILACGAGESSAGEERIKQIFERHGERVEVREDREEAQVKVVEEVKEADEGAVEEAREGSEEWGKFTGGKHPTAAPSASPEKEEGGEEETEEDGDVEKENRPLSADAEQVKVVTPHINGEQQNPVEPSHDPALPSAPPTSSSSVASSSPSPSSTASPTYPSTSSHKESPSQSTPSHHHPAVNGRGALPAIKPAISPQLEYEGGDEGGDDESEEDDDDVWGEVTDIDESSELFPLLTHLLFVFDHSSSTSLMPLPPTLTRFIDLPRWLHVLHRYKARHLLLFTSFVTSLITGDLSWPPSTLPSLRHRLDLPLSPRPHLGG